MVWVKNKSGRVERAVVYLGIVLIKGLLSLSNLGAKLLIISIIKESLFKVLNKDIYYE